ncbi:MAG: iron ABC transporter permease [Ilumatobacter sp.]|nr:iron ABC transporter permease [Ilumatobacter sp.]
MSALPRRVIAALSIPPSVGLAVFYVWPLLTLSYRAIDGDAVQTTLGRRATWEVAWFTLWQAVVSTLMTLVVGLAPAYIVARFNFRGRQLLLGLITALFVLPTVVMGAAFLALLPDGMNQSIAAVIAAHVVFNLAVVVRTVGPLWEQLPSDMEGAAATLGASPWRVFTMITLPLIRPALVAASSIVFIFTFTSFGVVRVIGAAGTRTLEVEVWRQAIQLGDIRTAVVLSILQMVMLAAVVVWSSRAQRRYSQPLGLEPSARRMPRRGSERRQVALIGITSFAVCGAPLFALAARSFSTPSGWSIAAWTQLGRAEVRPGIRLGIDPLDAVRNSVENALWATLFAVVIGALASLAIAAARNTGRFLDVGMMLPVGTSAVTIGFGMLITFDQAPYDWRAEWWLVPIGHALVAVPFVVRATVGVLRSVDPQLHAAAATLGASPTRAWRTVVMPFLWRPLTVGATLAAAISLGEFGATSFLSRSDSETVPIAIEQLLGRTGSLLQAQGYAMATVLAVVTIALVAAVDRSHQLRTLARSTINGPN